MKRFFLTLFLSSIFIVGRAQAGPQDDAAATSALDKIVTNDVEKANFGEARKKLTGVLDTCKKKSCSPAVMAKVHAVLGAIAAQLNQADEAKAAWADALAADPAVQLPPKTAPAIVQQLEDARKAAAPATPATPASPNTPTEPAAPTTSSKTPGRVKFERPPEVQKLQISVDDQPVPDNKLNEGVLLEPGTHSFHAEGLTRGARVSTDDKFEVEEGKPITLKLKLKPVALTRGQLDCMASATTQEEILACLPKETKNFIAHVALEMSAYADTLDVRVLSPAVRANVVSPTGGWNAGASYIVDVVTAASPDVVATASRRFQDVRHAVGVTAGYKPGRFGVQPYGNYSQERDYISRTLGLTASGDFFEKQVSPTLGYSFTWDTIGRAGTDYDIFSRRFDTHEITAGSTFILSPASLFVLGGGIALENGDQSKPYRHVPIFAPGVSVPAGASVEKVNDARLVAKPLEQLPLDRQRYSVAGRFVTRVGSRSTLRVEERAYTDTWSIMASTTDIRFFYDLNARLRVGPHVRFHYQTGSSFYNRIYGGVLEVDGSATLPKFRTTDRELSPMWGLTGGSQARFTLTKPGKELQIAAVANADVLFNYYSNALYIQSRLAGYGTIGLEADFE